MFHVIAVNLTPDLAHASADIGQGDFGELDAVQFHAVLEAFRRVDAIQNHEADPCLRIEVRGAKFIVRTAREKLFLYNARDTAEPAVELDADGIVRVLGARETTAAPEGRPAAPDVPPPHPSRGRPWIAALLLLLALALGGHTVYRAVRSHPVAPPLTGVVWIGETPEVDAIRRAAAGRYATGTAPGDRVITIAPDGHVSFGRVLASGERTDRTDTYRVGRRDRHVVLGTEHVGLISVENIDTLHYFGDAYERDH